MRINSSAGIQGTSEIDDDVQVKHDRFKRLLEERQAPKAEAEADPPPGGGDVVARALRAAAEERAGMEAAAMGNAPARQLEAQSNQGLNQQLERLQHEVDEPRSKAVHEVAESKQELTRRAIHDVE